MDFSDEVGNEMMVVCRNALIPLLRYYVRIKLISNGSSINFNGIIGKLLKFSNA